MESFKITIALAVMKEEYTCPTCHIAFTVSSEVTEKIDASYCPFCRCLLNLAKASTVPAADTRDEDISQAANAISFLAEHLPIPEQVQFSIGPYQVLNSIGKGGMGEVFLAYDTSCGRRIALKKIRPDLVDHQPLHNRFLKEARITSQLTHPAIITIYSIHNEPSLTYYTMPYIQGETLKQLLRQAREHEKAGEKADHLSGSIPSLIRIFLSICQAVAYAHTKNILHRDIKPENIIVGEYGQVVILDWGLAKLLGVTESEEELNEDSAKNSNPLHHLTHIGKVVGTIAYMAPERALGHPANFQTDIYSLGVILYQLLTLKYPFHRESLKQFRLNMHMEKIADPIEVAPYRDIPKSLSRVVLKCLAANPEQRYFAVDDLINDLENYIEGRSEWFQIAELDINNKTDWKFQENVLIAEHIALTHDTDISDWVSLMISKTSFQENIKLEARVKIGNNGHGIGFLISVPEDDERKHLNDGYCLWLGTDLNPSTKLLRSTLEVLHAPEVVLRRGEWEQIRIEKFENHIHFYLNDILQFSYISHLPLTGTHMGLLARDDDFRIENFYVYIGNQNVTVNCLAVPDAFLAHNDYAMALSEYRRIGYSFPGRAEGREAMFRAGVTLLEQANIASEKERKEELYDLALEEFHKLYNTPGAPLEYLGKALVYQAQDDYEEESKCFELAYRRYPKHPLLPILQEHIVYRLHESSRYNRQATFNFLLLVLNFLPEVASNKNTTKLLNSLERHWEPLFFIENTYDMESDKLKKIICAFKLSFWLAKPYVLAEIIQNLTTLSPPHFVSIGNALFALIELGSWNLAKVQLDMISELSNGQPEWKEFSSFAQLLEIALSAYTVSIESALDEYLKHNGKSNSKQSERVLLFLLNRAIDLKKGSLVIAIHAKQLPLSMEAQQKVDECTIWAYLLNKNWVAAGELLHHYPIEVLSQDTSLLHFLYGCWLYVTEGKDIADVHFSGIFEVPYPRTWALFGYYLHGKVLENQGWISKSFLWERRQLYRQLVLFYSCIDNDQKANYFQEKVFMETIEASI